MTTGYCHSWDSGTRLFRCHRGDGIKPVCRARPRGHRSPDRLYFATLQAALLWANSLPGLILYRFHPELARETVASPTHAQRHRGPARSRTAIREPKPPGSMSEANVRTPRLGHDSDEQRTRRIAIGRDPGRQPSSLCELAKDNSPRSVVMLILSSARGIKKHLHGV